MQQIPIWFKIDSAVQKRLSGLGLGNTKIILTVHIRLRFKILMTLGSGSVHAY